LEAEGTFTCFKRLEFTDIIDLVLEDTTIIIDCHAVKVYKAVADLEFLKFYEFDEVILMLR